MHKGTIWIFFVLLLAYLMLMFCVAAEPTPNKQQNNSNNNSNNNNNNKGLSYWHNRNATTTSARANINTNTNVAVSRQFDAAEEARRRHSLYHRHWWWHALAIAYWVKVKVIIVGFFVGSAIFLGLRYFWPHKCHGEVYRESPVIYDHPPHSFSHDHSFPSLPYSANFDTTGFDTSGGGGGGPGSSGGGGGYTYDIGSSGSDIHRRKRRSIKEMRVERDVRMLQRQRQQKQQQQQQQSQLHQHVPTEEQIGDMMFYFLGLDSKACRRRFICEMEFRSRLHPLTSMAFRIVGRSFFAKYTNDRNEGGQAKSFGECAAVNPECVFIEQGQEDDNGDGSSATEQSEVETVENAIENELTATTASDNNDDMEKQNEENLKAERRNTKRRHVNGGRGGINLLAQRIWARSN